MILSCLRSPLFYVAVSTYDAGLNEPPISDSRRLVWRILFFQLLSAITQILATLSSLVDIFSGRSPLPLGTEHVALLIVAWAPVVAFGVRTGRLPVLFRRFWRS